MMRGLHLLPELNGCPFEVLNDETAVRMALCDAAGVTGATWLGEVSHAFNPAGEQQPNWQHPNWQHPNWQQPN